MHAWLWKGCGRWGTDIKAARRPTLYLLSQPDLYHTHCQKGLWCIKNKYLLKVLKIDAHVNLVLYTNLYY